MFVPVSIGALLVLFLCGTFFSAAEMAFSSLSHARIKAIEAGGGKKGTKASRVSHLYENQFDHVISTLLICNNTVAIATATVSAALFVHLIGDWGYFVSTFVVSAIIVIFTDVFPKSMASEQPEKIAVWCVPTIGFLLMILKPVNFVVLAIKNKLGAAFVSKDSTLTEEEQSLRGQELIYMVEEAEKDGAFDTEDTALITNAITWHDISAWDILTPRVDIISVPLQASMDEVATIFSESGYSRIPVYEDSLDNIKGIVHMRDFLGCMCKQGDSLTLADIVTPAVFTVTNARITDLLSLLKKEQSHMAIVTDEYGGTEGLITLDDILERLVGHIWDEADEVVDEFIPLSDNTFKVLGTAYIDDMFAYFQIKAESSANSVGGWVQDMLRRVPEVGDSFVFEHLQVSVTKADHLRVEECHIQVLTPPQEEDN